MPFWLTVAAQLSILGYALLAGVFLAFSDFIMRALRETPSAGGPAAMQAINREVFHYVFIPLFLAMAPVSVLLAVAAAMLAPSPMPFVAAAAVYVAGAFGVTVVRNVPMNNRLAEFEAGSADGQDYWAGTYLPRWTTWNSVRAAACLLSAGLMLFGLF